MGKFESPTSLVPALTATRVATSALLIQAVRAGSGTESLAQFSSRIGMKSLPGQSGVAVGPKGVTCATARNELAPLVREAPAANLDDLCDGAKVSACRTAGALAFKNGLFFPYLTNSGKVKDYKAPHLTITGDTFSARVSGRPVYARQQLASELNGLKKEVLGYRAADLSSGPSGRTGLFVIYYQDKGNTDPSKIKMGLFSVDNVPQVEDKLFSINGVQRPIRGNYEQWDEIAKRVLDSGALLAAAKHFCN